MWDHALAHEGFIVFRMDPRSASGKGAVSAWTAYKHLGVQELEDIKDAINWLKQKPYVDGSRIGMSGHSYGGYITSYAMTHCDLFAAGIAGAPVTDWRDYDSIYTERYMGLPQDNPEGYNVSSVVRAAGKLHGKLLILHGAIDDNVSLRNTMRLVAGAASRQQGLRADDLSVVPPRDLRTALHQAPARFHPPDARWTRSRRRPARPATWLRRPGRILPDAAEGPRRAARAGKAALERMIGRTRSRAKARSSLPPGPATVTIQSLLGVASCMKRDCQLRFRMSSVTQTAATLDDLYRVEGKAELIAGRIVPLMATGRRPSRVAFRICRSLDDYAQATGRGEAYTDNKGSRSRRFPRAASRSRRTPRISSARSRRTRCGFSPGRRSSLSKSAARTTMVMRLLPLQQPNGPTTSRRGRSIVWDVDPIADRIFKYRFDAPEQPEVFGRGQEADAEPAVPGWRMAVDSIFA